MRLISFEKFLANEPGGRGGAHVSTRTQRSFSIDPELLTLSGLPIAAVPRRLEKTAGIIFDVIYRRGKLLGQLRRRQLINVPAETPYCWRAAGKLSR